MSTKSKKKVPVPTEEKQKEIDYLNRSNQVFIHNVGHHDLYFDLYTLDGEPLGWHKPNSSGFLKLGNTILEATKKNPDLFQLVTEYQGKKVGGYYELAQGVEVQNNKITEDRTMGMWEWAEAAGRDEHKHCSPLLKLAPKEIEFLVIKRIMMPLIDGALRKFENDEFRKFQKLNLFLVSSGDINDQSSTHQLTQLLVKLTQLRFATYQQDHKKFLVHHRPIKHSPHYIQATHLLELETDIRKCALELANEIENAHGNREDWAKQLAVHLSANTGTPSMIAALTLSLAEWSPMMHMIGAARKSLQSTPENPAEVYNAKLYQAESVSEWIEVDAQDLDQINQQAVAKLKKWADEYKEKRPVRPKEMDDKDERLFFHRKGLKEVLCVVVIQNPEDHGKLEFIRGVNVEVSLPTGTLCAERNAISTAFCQFPQLERKDIKAVAVLSLDEKLSKLGPCGACQEWLKKVLEVNPDLRVIGFNNPNAEKVYVRPALMI